MPTGLRPARRPPRSSRRRQAVAVLATAVAVGLASACTGGEGGRGGDAVASTAVTGAETTSAPASAAPETTGETYRGVLLAPAPGQSSTAPLWVKLEGRTIGGSDVVSLVRLSRRALVCSSTGEMRELATVERPAAVRFTWEPPEAIEDSLPPAIAVSQLVVEGC